MEFQMRARKENWKLPIQKGNLEDTTPKDNRSYRVRRGTIWERRASTYRSRKRRTIVKCRKPWHPV